MATDWQSIRQLRWPTRTQAKGCPIWASLEDDSPSKDGEELRKFYIEVEFGRV